jgi:2-dehydropantoate 2-reductase
VSFNPISALTGGTMAEICRHPESRALVRSMMEEAESIAGRLGIQLRRTIDERLAGAEAVGEHKTSMLQDLEAGRRLEMDALVGTVLELGRLVDVPTPAIESVDACLRLRVETLEAQRDTRADAGRATGRRVRRVS